MLQSLLVWESGAVKSAQRKQELLFKEVKKEKNQNQTSAFVGLFPLLFPPPREP